MTPTLTPFPTITPIPTITPLPTNTPIPTEIPTPTKAETPSSSSSSVSSQNENTINIGDNRPSCNDLGKNNYNPQPNSSRLRNELCQDGWLARPYSPDVMPVTLVDVKTEFEKRGVDYFGSEKNRSIDIEIIDNLSAMIKAVEDLNQQGKTKCIPYINACYRSFEYQAGAFVYDKCVTGVNDDPSKSNWCGTAPAGFSTHQTVAVDIWCYYLVNNRLQKTWAETIDSVLGKQVMREYGFIKPIPNDSPHYNYIL